MRTFLTIWIGQLVSIIGSGLTSFALAVWIFQKTGQATPLALTVLFGNLPRILLAPIAGSLADRWNRRWLMILADTGDALVTLAVLLLFASGQMQVWHIYLAALVSASFAAFQEPAYVASISTLVPKEQLARANGLTQTSQAVEMLAAPLLAGILFAPLGVVGIILIDFITYFAAIGTLLVVRVPQPPPPPTEPGKRANFMTDAAYGWRYLRQRPGLFWLLWYFAMTNFLLNFAAVLVSPLVLSFSTPAALGSVQMMFGAGMLAGSVLLSAWGGPKGKRIYAVIGFIALCSTGLILAGLRPLFWLVGAGLFVLTFCVPLASGPASAIFQAKVEPGVQGRVFSIRLMISRSMMPLAFLISGPLADYVFEPLLRTGGPLAPTPVALLTEAGPGRGIGLMLILAGLALLLVSGLAYTNTHIRNVEEELPDVTLPAASPENPEEAALGATSS